MQDQLLQLEAELVAGVVLEEAELAVAELVVVVEAELELVAREAELEGVEQVEQREQVLVKPAAVQVLRAIVRRNTQMRCQQL